MSLLQAAARKKAPAKTRLTRKQAARVLKRSILGPRKSEIDALVNGNYEQWLDEQMQMPPFQLLHEMHLSQAPGSYLRRVRLANGSYFDVSDQGISTPTTENLEPGQIGGFRELCLKFAQIEHPDVLRHRVCRALLEILVASVVGQTNDYFTWGGSLTGYYSRLQRSCFTTYREILKDITLSNEMAIYLTYSGNAKANPVTGAQPDENYAREIMQLFSIGLFELHPDGTKKKTGELDPTDPRYVLNGQDDVPTYGPDDIKAVARIFTGTMIPREDVVSPESSRFVKTAQFMGSLGSQVGNGRHPNGALSNIAFFSTDNETSLAKVALPGTGGSLLNVPVGTGGMQALDMLLDALVNHPSCAPYVSKRLIQLLTCSNPRAEYVARVSAVFKNNGSGQVGDMKAVLKAIYLDQDALSPTEKGLSLKTRDIDLAVRSAMRSFTVNDIIDPNGLMSNNFVPATGKVSAFQLEHQTFNASSRNRASTKAPFQAASVFGTWPVDYATNAAREAGEVSPELHTWDEAQIATLSAQPYKSRIRNVFTLTGGSVADAVSNANLSATFDSFAEMLSGVEVPSALKTQILQYVQEVTDSNQRFDRLIESFTLTALASFQE